MGITPHFVGKKVHLTQSVRLGNGIGLETPASNIKKEWDPVEKYLKASFDPNISY
uniref:Uncharacterized protein n=1 Tax=Kuenenia stuttgartiensis TaxID=174633 RepID=Q1Q7F8_KUEST|nr:unknown protein [Candidatus Kuenenia stuttgartiensis]